jgi:hypothetical protein
MGTPADLVLQQALSLQFLVGLIDYLVFHHHFDCCPLMFSVCKTVFNIQQFA